jgi:hypothetical protein
MYGAIQHFYRVLSLLAVLLFGISGVCA